MLSVNLLFVNLLSVNLRVWMNGNQLQPDWLILCVIIPRYVCWLMYTCEEL